VKLSAEEQAMLDGEQGAAVQRAMQIVVTLGRIYEAEALLPVASAQVAGVSYRNLGAAGLDFLRDWAAQGARVRVPTTLNPAGMDLEAWPQQGFSDEFARGQQDVIATYVAMGICPTCTCTPYLVGNVPLVGEHVAWSESSAVVYANSVLGARSNREGGPSALAAALCGRTAAFGLHLDANRRATHCVQVRCGVHGEHEYAALGYLVGRQVGDGVPYFTLEQEPSATPDELKALGAALASSGAVALFHVAGVTPEAQQRPDLCSEATPQWVIETLEPTIAELDASRAAIDLVVIGCPHASLEGLGQVASLVCGRSLRCALWVTTSRQVRQQGEALGLVQAIEAAGGQVVADSCVVVAPMDELPYRALATNSAKMAHYALPHAGLQVRFGSLEHCVHAACSGRWGD
jgi:predicted aconitase